MNRGKKIIDKKVKKKIDKEIRLAQNPSFATPSFAEAKALSKKETALFKKPKKGSKRTTPGEIPAQSSPPKIVHVEGRRWIKTLEKQNLTDSRILTKKLSKRKSVLKPARKTIKGWR